MGVSLIGGLALAQLALGAVQTSAQNRAIDRDVQEQQAVAQAQLAELERQRTEADELAAEQKSDRVRQADREVGALRVRLAEVGGLGTVNAVRGIVDVGAAEGFDLARIERNRRNRKDSLRQSQLITKGRARSAVEVGEINKQANRVSFLGAGLNIAARAAGDIRDIRRPTDPRSE